MAETGDGVDARSATRRATGTTRRRATATKPHRARSRNSTPGSVAHSTTLTIGCVDSVRYSSSSCSRLVAVTVIVRPRYLPPLLGRSLDRRGVEGRVEAAAPRRRSASAKPSTFSAHHLDRERARVLDQRSARAALGAATHDRLRRLGPLVGLVQPRIHRPGLAAQRTVADRLAVELRHRQHFLGGRAEQHLVGGAARRPRRSGAGCRRCPPPRTARAAGRADAFEHMLALRRAEQRAFVHDPDVAGRGLGAGSRRGT